MAKGGEVRSLPERVRDAVKHAGARIGLPDARDLRPLGGGVRGVGGRRNGGVWAEKGRGFLTWQVAERVVR
jgi:hypothetical protein